MNRGRENIDRSFNILQSIILKSRYIRGNGDCKNLLFIIISPLYGFMYKTLSETEEIVAKRDRKLTRFRSIQNVLRKMFI